jgi:3-isopropylmalate dehydrogenase
MSTFQIAVVPGDGIGPEVCKATIKVIQAALPHSVSLHFVELPAGARHYQESGIALPDSTISGCREAHAILLGAAGLPGVLYEDGTEAGQDTTLNLRRELDLYANVRPIKLYPGVEGPLKGDPAIDYVIVRENTEGLYASRGKGMVEPGIRATDTMEITRKGVERVVRQAAELCMLRQGSPSDGKRRITICDKSNVLRSYAFFRSVAVATLSDYPEIEIDYALVDALSMYLVTRPETYDVIVSENLLGDIMSDLGAATIGGLGMADSAELGDDHALFQASHGSAPDIAGKNLANPTATILSGASMLEWLGQRHECPPLTETASRIRKAISTVLRERKDLPLDLGGNARTDTFVDTVCRHL